MRVVVAVSVYADAGGERVEVGDVVGGQGDVCGAAVLLKAFGAAGAGDRDDLRVLCKEPGQGDLAWVGVPGLDECGDVVDERTGPGARHGVQRSVVAAASSVAAQAASS
ncbi:hypothetical protein [Streptomyces violaceusniger]|uniref:Uncharacterized protein n=1 Tax=Streptomyces violaceusniger (strain Tu 4113) TaxID=653045 RepID=G2NZ92_STRV4|nr:hypothetical protein [Streptomyces violaceusniger]AEM83135.1 hypothetical protein Strvi_3462 [Streptomyces violaceusniger Tu 4113]